MLHSDHGRLVEEDTAVDLPKILQSEFQLRFWRTQSTQGLRKCLYTPKPNSTLLSRPHYLKKGLPG